MDRTGFPDESLFSMCCFGTAIIAVTLWVMSCLFSDVDNRSRIKRAAVGMMAFGLFLFMIVNAMKPDNLFFKVLGKLFDALGERGGMLVIFAVIITSFSLTGFGLLNLRKDTNIKGCEITGTGFLAMGGCFVIALFAILYIFNSLKSGNGFGDKIETALNMIKGAIWIWKLGILIAAAGVICNLALPGEPVEDVDIEESEEEIE